MSGKVGIRVLGYKYELLTFLDVKHHSAWFRAFESLIFQRKFLCKYFDNFLMIDATVVKTWPVNIWLLSSGEV